MEITLFNSIVAGNSAGSFANVNTPSYTTLSAANLVSGDPQLQPLGNYGGPTQTMPPRANSPAINAGSNILGTVPVQLLFPTDQRGRPRKITENVDIGAVESLAPIITTIADEVDGSLRQAVSETDLAGNFITFAPGLTGHTIDLTGGPLVLRNRTTIDASALPNGLRLNGNGRVVEVPSGATVTLRALTLQNGYDNMQGGGVYNAGDLNLDRCTIANNGFSDSGDNTVSITPDGGGIYNAGNLTIEQCTITANCARNGSGISSRDGASMTIRHSTIAGNESEVGTAGIRNNGALTLYNSIVAGNYGSGFSPNFSEGANVVRLGNNLTAGEPMLMALGNYGGPTQTMPPQPDSPTKNTGGTGGPAYASDQRGFPRVIGTAVDLGAVEEIPGATQLGASLAGIWQSDTDGDGITFGIEYALGTDPFSPDASAAGHLRISLDSAKRITFGRNLNAVSNTQWVLKRSLDLQPGSFSEVYRFHGPSGVSTVTGVVGGINTNSGFTITDPSTSGRAFYRIETQFTP